MFGTVALCPWAFGQRLGIAQWQQYGGWNLSGAQSDALQVGENREHGLASKWRMMLHVFLSSHHLVLLLLVWIWMMFLLF